MRQVQMQMQMEIQADTHTHTVASGHAYSTLAENVAVAAEKGLKLLAVTDHGPSMPGAPHFWFFNNMRVIPRIMNGVGILRGIEANIIADDGGLDAADDVLAGLDIVIGSLHEPVYAPTDQATHTAAVVAAIRSGKIDIFGHGGNPAFPIDVDAVAEAAAENRVLIEINNSSFTTSRKGSEKNCAALAKAVQRAGGLLTFGTDAHLALLVGGFDKCQALMESVGFPKEQLISMDAGQLLALLAKRRPAIDYSGFAPLFV